LLLARSPHFLPGVYSALAGFVEPGETVEQCVHRETQEEVGVRVKNLRYVCSQSWPFPHSLMLAFTAEYDGGDIRPQPGEIEDAGWYHIDTLPTIPAQLSVAYQLIRHTADCACQPINAVEIKEPLAPFRLLTTSRFLKRKRPFRERAGDRE
jgi:NAD+ diphosphatase